jgi:HEPN domain-containing protein
MNMNPHEEWLFKADRDLKGAMGMVDLKLEDLAVYHAQQCAEKALKGYLIFRSVPLVKSHDLGRLLSLCVDFDSDFLDIQDALQNLDGLDTRFRYPDAHLVPDENTTEEAIKCAEIVLNFIVNKCL